MVAQGWQTTRVRVEPLRLSGWIVGWKGRFGWIQPETSITHAEAQLHGGRVFVHVDDLLNCSEILGGESVSFFAYADGNGIGAEEVLVEGAQHNGSGVRDTWASKGKAQKGGRGKGSSGWSGNGWAGKGGALGVQRTIEKAVKGVIKGIGKTKAKLSDENSEKDEPEEPEEPETPTWTPGCGRPNRKKVSHTGQAGVLVWASSEMQGWRPAMEDAVVVDLSLAEPLEAHAMFGVFDGHGGAKVSARVSAELPSTIVYCAAAHAKLEGSVTGSEEKDGGIVWSALQTALPLLDEQLRAEGDGESGGLSSGGVWIPSEVQNAYSLMGSTAVVALVECDGGASVGQPKRIVVANVGDSRAILCRGGTAVPLSEDHKPELPTERSRIENAGGSVGQVGPCYRVDCWGLNLSRALGDFHYKANESLPAEEQKVIPVPEMRAIDLTDEDEFLFLGCDGVFELHSSQDAIDKVREGLQEGKSLTEAVENLVDCSCSENLMRTQGNGGDNVSAMVVLLR